MKAAPNSCCAVCDMSDARGLTTTRLSTGEIVIVCGNHELMYKRSSKTVASRSELRAMLRDRRRSCDRRSLQIDELGAQLSEAFSEEKRAANDRRR
ncbi:MAG: hypothetical protein ACRELY_12475 [Polyangiaceae bacterium]